ncbi:MAG TPA: hypothetical protein VJY35_14675 [Candidatus Eisenbacteria bacterium]|nr:hypothetical protein [Candidatus Eisenbacteria bacterium]
MKRMIVSAAAVAMLLCTGVQVVSAQTDQPPGEHYNVSLGFHNTEAPLGVRWWFAGQKVALDLGLGFSSTPAGAPAPADNEKLLRWSVDVGVPIVMRSWSHVHLMFRPGVLYTSQEQVTDPGPAPPFATDTETTFHISAEIEGEIFLMDNASVSASHGVRYTSFNPIGTGDSITSFDSFGNNFTTVGFHIYFFGGSQ